MDVWIKVLTEWYLSVSSVMHTATQAKLLFWRVEWVRTCWHQRRFLFETRLTVASYQEPLKMDLFFLFFFSEWHKKNTQQQVSYPAGVFIGSEFFFLMWRMWHICSHLHSVQCAFSGHSRVPAGETSSLAAIPADTRARGISHIPFKDTRWYKNGRIVQGSQWRPVYLTAAEVSDVFTWVTTLFFFSNYTCNDCYFESMHGFFATAAHMTDAVEATCCLFGVNSLNPELLCWSSLSWDTCWDTKET